MRGLESILAEHPFFAGLPSDVTAILAGCARNEKYTEGEVIASEGQAADRFFLVRHGSVAVELRSPGRGPLIVETVGEGEVFGWSAFVAPYRFMFDMRARQLTRLVSLDSACLRNKFDSDPQLGYAVHRQIVPIMAKQLDSVRLQMLNLYSDTAGAN
jgi:CRP-like cAMP-binding protein